MNNFLCYQDQSFYRNEIFCKNQNGIQFYMRSNISLCEKKILCPLTHRRNICCFNVFAYVEVTFILDISVTININHVRDSGPHTNTRANYALVCICIYDTNKWSARACLQYAANRCCDVVILQQAISRKLCIVLCWPGSREHCRSVKSAACCPYCQCFNTNTVFAIWRQTIGVLAHYWIGMHHARARSQSTVNRRDDVGLATRQRRPLTSPQS